MFEAPHGSRPPEAGLDLIANQQRFMSRAPFPERSHVFRWGKSCAAALICFEDYAGYSIRLDIMLTQRTDKTLKRGIRRAEAVGKRNLDESGIEITYPFFERRNAAGLLRAQRAAVKCLLIGNDDLFAAPPGL